VLVNQDNIPVQGENGDIVVGSGEFKIQRNGDVYNNAGEYVDTLRLVSFDDNSLLRKEGENMYYNTTANMTDSTATVRQGFIEGSNVDTVSAMVDMIKTYRNYETNQRVIQSIDSIEAKTVELGKV
jgi:flagellar basal-body rod protein FlgG